MADGYGQLGLYLDCPTGVTGILFEAKTLHGNGSNAAVGGRDVKAGQGEERRGLAIKGPDRPS
jgi:hypothetical protein